MTVALSVVGKSDVGKTTLLEKLLPELKQRGYRVATIKHDVHGFDIDLPGKDSWRHAQAGSDAVIITSAQKLALIKKMDHDAPLEELRGLLGLGYDIILAEGFKDSPELKIEVHRRERGAILCTEEEMVALVTDEALALAVPQFGFNEIGELSDFLEERFLRRYGE